ncbi:MAG: hypothetical protein D6814_11585 [Calditrichaeota bacterium]|nr:MAG: hypothetical protein D6814_11585 [Calditrichota bacterium]
MLVFQGVALRFSILPLRGNQIASYLHFIKSYLAAHGRQTGKLFEFGVDPVEDLFHRVELGRTPIDTKGISCLFGGLCFWNHASYKSELFGIRIVSCRTTPIQRGTPEVNQKTTPFRRAGVSARLGVNSKKLT